MHLNRPWMMAGLMALATACSGSGASEESTSSSGGVSASGSSSGTVASSGGTSGTGASSTGGASTSATGTSTGASSAQGTSSAAAASTGGASSSDTSAASTGGSSGGTGATSSAGASSSTGGVGSSSDAGTSAGSSSGASSAAATGSGSAAASSGGSSSGGSSSGGTGSSTTGTGCGNVTLAGSCAGNVLTYCDPAEGLVRTVDCATTNQLCDEINASYGFDCAQPVGAECLGRDGVFLCAGTNPACLIAPNATSGQVTLCRDNVGTCTPSADFVPVCLNATTLAADCTQGQPLGYDCVAVGGTGCTAGACVGITAGNLCSDLTRCAAGLTCQPDAQGASRCTAGGGSSSSSGGTSSSSGGSSSGGSSSGGSTAGCGSVTLEGSCSGNVLTYCAPGDTLVTVDCAPNGFTCGLVNPAWGYDCLAPVGDACVFSNGAQGSQQVFCAGTNPGCVIREDAAGATQSVCQANVGACTANGFAPACVGNNLLNVSCLSSQPLTYDCQSLGGTGCSNGTCVGVTAGNLCDAFLVCAAGLTCQADAQGVDRCTAPVTGCGTVTSEGTCTNNVITYCAPDMTVRTLDCGASMLTCQNFPDALGYDCAAATGSQCYVNDGTTDRQLLCQGTNPACVFVPAVGEPGVVDTQCRSNVGVCTEPAAGAPFVPVCATPSVLHVGCLFGQGLSYDCAALGGTGCTNGVCVGAAAGSLCEPLIQCAAGLSCVTSTPGVVGTCQAPTGNQDLANVRAAADGPVNMLPVTDVVVTYVKPLVGSAVNDPAGFTVQASATGPAVFVAVDAATLTPVPVAGDRVTFFATSVGTVGGQKRVTTLTGFSRVGQGAALAGLTQNLSNAADLVTNLGTYESERVTVTGTLTSGFTASGTGHVAANLDTAAVTGNTNLRLRVPETLAATLGARAGCTVVVTGTPLWRFNAVAQVSAWTAQEIVVSNCPMAMGNATLRINEVNPRATGDCDLVELRAVAGGSLTGMTLTARGSGSSNLSVVLGAGMVAKNDLLVVHLGPDACFGGTRPVNETAINGDTGAYAYATAWDVYATVTNNLVNGANVLQVLDGAATLQDALLLGFGTNAPAADTLTRANAVAAAGQWVSTVGTYVAGNFNTDAVLDGNLTNAATTSVARLNNADTQTKADWTNTAAGAPQTFGALNAGQTALP